VATPLWTEYENPDARVAFLTPDGGPLLFHTTESRHVAAILADGFKDHTCSIGFNRRSSAHGVHVGFVPAIPASVDYFDPRYEPIDAAWILVRAPKGAERLAVSLNQDTSWPLLQACFSASAINQWPREQLFPNDVLRYRPHLRLETYVDEAIDAGWLPRDLALGRRLQGAV
jgi:hypothetical protein